MIKTKLGAHRILMGAEMDCCDSTDDGRRFYVELKTSREVGMVVGFSLFSCFSSHYQGYNFDLFYLCFYS